MSLVTFESEKTELLSKLYAVFNARDIDAAITDMAADVLWPKAFKGGFVCGPAEIRSYWTEQWYEINPHVEPISYQPVEPDQILVEVHLIVHNLTGFLIADEQIYHLYTFKK